MEAEVKGLVARGYREVVLTGIHLSSYGTEHMEGSPVKGGDWDSGALWDLIERIHRVEGLERIRRLGTLRGRHQRRREFPQFGHRFPGRFDADDPAGRFGRGKLAQTCY